jgi:hypothetical protein
MHMHQQQLRYIDPWQNIIERYRDQISSQHVHCITSKASEKSFDAYTSRSTESATQTALAPSAPDRLQGSPDSRRPLKVLEKTPRHGDTGADTVSPPWRRRRAWRQRFAARCPVLRLQTMLSKGHVFAEAAVCLDTCTGCPDAVRSGSGGQGGGVVSEASAGPCCSWSL